MASIGGRRAAFRSLGMGDCKPTSRDRTRPGKQQNAGGRARYQPCSGKQRREQNEIAPIQPMRLAKNIEGGRKDRRLLEESKHCPTGKPSGQKKFVAHRISPARFPLSRSYWFVLSIVGSATMLNSQAGRESSGESRNATESTVCTAGKVGTTGVQRRGGHDRRACWRERIATRAFDRGAIPLSDLRAVEQALTSRLAGQQASGTTARRVIESLFLKSTGASARYRVVLKRRQRLLA